MTGSLALHRSSLFVGGADKTARVRVYDLDGRVLLPGFTFRDPRAGRSTASGLAVDDDRRLWVADTPSSRVRRFSLFGREEGGLGLGVEEALEVPPGTDRGGAIRGPVAVALEGNAEEGRLLIGCAGERRHAVQLFDVGGSYVASYRSLGVADGLFRHVRGVALVGRRSFVVEGHGARTETDGRVQVFRDGEFHFAFSVPVAAAGRFEPVAVAPLSDGRVVVACGGGASHLLLVDATGRLLRTLAGPGEAEGEVAHPSDVVVDEGASDRASRVALLDRDGERIQIFTLEGRCYGVFGERA